MLTKPSIRRARDARGTAIIDGIRAAVRAVSDTALAVESAREAHRKAEDDWTFADLRLNTRGVVFGDPIFPTREEVSAYAADCGAAMDSLTFALGSLYGARDSAGDAQREARRAIITDWMDTRDRVRMAGRRQAPPPPQGPARITRRPCPTPGRAIPLSHCAIGGETEDEVRAALRGMGYTVREDPDHGAYVLDERPDAW